jgi:integrase/recombinase XerD
VRNHLKLVVDRADALPIGLAPPWRGIGEEDMELVRGFLANQTMRGLSSATVRRRRWTLTTFVDGIAPRGIADATTIDVERFLSARPTASTRRALLGDLRAFYRWAQSREHVLGDPTAPIETPRVPKRLPTPLTRAELERAWNAAGWDLRVLIALGAGVGLRVSEMAALHTDDLDLERRVLVVRDGKGGKDRVVPMNHGVVDVLRHCAPGPVTSYRSGGSVSNRLRAHFDSVGIAKRPHDLRATFATEAARVSSGNMVLVAQLMGHESMTTTQRYVALTSAGWDVVDQMYELPAA